MEFSSVIILLSILACSAVGQHHEDLTDELPPEAPTAALQYMECMEGGHCTDHSSVLQDEVPIEESEHGETKQEIDPQEIPSYFQLCEKFHLKMAELEREHPELKVMKRELLKKMYAYSSQFDSKLNDHESIVLRLLAFVIHVAEKLKIDFTKIIHEKPVHKPIAKDSLPVEEIIAEEDHAPFVGSIRGTPGVHFPNYSEIPITSFTCSDKEYVPGFYADLETGCQVFHVCYEHRRESFLCPLGTIFNQPILACDYWYSSNCSLAPLYYVNEVTERIEVSKENEDVEELITTAIEGGELDSKKLFAKDEMKSLLKFLPVKAKVEDIPIVHKPITYVPLKNVAETADKIFEGFVATGTKIITKANEKLTAIPEPDTFAMPKVVSPFPGKAKLAVKVIKSDLAAKGALSMATKLGSKAKIATAAIPIIKAKTVSAAVPLVKAKVAAAVPIVKAKAAAAAAVPIVKAKAAAAAAVPIVKAKAAAVPVVKAKIASAAAIPLVKAKITKAAAVPIVKTKAAAVAVPILKAKVAKAVDASIIKAKVPIAKAKVAKAVAIPAVKAKISSKVKVPLIKSKFLALPIAKTKLGAGAIPVIKAKKSVKTLPYVKMAALKPKLVVPALKIKSVGAGIPIVKTKLAKAAMISPLTKKALAVGYMKLLKAKKLALMG